MRMTLIMTAIEGAEDVLREFEALAWECWKRERPFTDDFEAYLKPWVQQAMAIEIFKLRNPESL